MSGKDLEQILVKVILVVVVLVVVGFALVKMVQNNNKAQSQAVNGIAGCTQGQPGC
jgi:flagellar biogenesis protein FliO